MKKLSMIAAAAGLTAGAALIAPSAGSALPLAPSAAPAVADSMIVQAQSRHYRRHGHRYVYRDRGWNRGAVIGGAAALGILGAAAAASAYPYGGYNCYIEQRPVHDQWGRYVGVQNVRVCP